MKPVLVAYASVYGSTREVAEKIAEILKDHGIEARLRSACEVGSVADYSAVVLGGALYFFRWHRHARKFLRRHRSQLRKMPIAVFAMGPFKDSPEDFASARRHLGRSLDRRGWLAPVSTQVFGGVFDPAKLRFPHKNPAMKLLPASDVRDWDAIHAWADALPRLLGLLGS